MNASSANRGSFDILLVEDNRADIVLFKKAIEQVQSAHRIHVAMDGVEAMAFLRREDTYHDAPHPALILLDLNLPGKDGREVLAEIKADDGLRRIPVVMLTSSHHPDDILDCYNLHANAYMTKAENFGELLDLTKKISEYWLADVKLPPN